MHRRHSVARGRGVFRRPQQSASHRRRTRSAGSDRRASARAVRNALSRVGWPDGRAAGLARAAGRRTRIPRGRSALRRQPRRRIASGRHSDPPHPHLHRGTRPRPGRGRARRADRRAAVGLVGGGTSPRDRALSPTRRR